MKLPKEPNNSMKFVALKHTQLLFKKKNKMVAFWRDAPYFVTVSSMALVTLARVVNISLLFLFYDFIYFFGFCAEVTIFKAYDLSRNRC